ncbi:MAG: cytochrome c oxidase subunit 3 [Myxococcaceae bacterium]
MSPSAPLGSVLPYRPPRAKEETTAYLGMVVALASWAMMFGALFFGYAFVRARAGTWPPPGVNPVDPLLPAVNSAVIALSSAVLQRALNDVRRARLKWLSVAVLSTCFLGALFLAAQGAIWVQLDLTPGEGGAYSSVVFGLCLLHAAHVLVGLVGLGRLVPKARRGELNATHHLPLKLWTLYWHFVGIVWALMFVSIFVL